MAKIFDKLSHAIAGIKTHGPDVPKALQEIATCTDALETHLQQMQAQKPANQTDLQHASSTVQGLKGHVQTLVSALREGSGKPPSAA